jgi:hypothetical protein
MRGCVWVCSVVGLGGEVDFRGLGAAAGGVLQGEFREDLDAAAAFRVQAGVEDVGADVLVALFDECETGDAAVEVCEEFAVGDRGEFRLASISAISSTVLRYTERVLARV